MKCVYGHEMVILKYHPSFYNQLTLKGNIFSLLEFITIFWVVFMSLLMVYGFF